MNFKKRKPSKSFVFHLLLAALLLLIAWFFLFRNITGYRAYIQEENTKSMEKIAEAVDSTISSIYSDYREEMNYTMNRSEFIAAKNTYLSSGNVDNLFSLMVKSIPNRRASTKTVLAFKNGEIIASTDRRTDYILPVESSLDSKMQVRICSDYDDRPYLGFFVKRSAICFGIIVYLEDFYVEVEENSGMLSLGELLLLDKENFVFLHRDEDFHGDYLNDEGDYDDPLLQILMISEKNSLRSTIDLETEGEEGDNAYLRVSLYPASLNTNEYFSIGVLKDSQEEMTALRKMNIQLLVFAEMFFVGILLLFLIVYRLYGQREKSLREIQKLQQKKDAMEALNKETLEFAHHQRLETIGQLTSGIAHDFNNLLTPIMGYSLMVMEKLPPEDTESYDNLLEVYNASKKAKDLISRLSDLSRKNSAFTMRYVDPNKMIKNAITISESSKPKTVRLEENLDCHDVWLYGNEIQFSQLMINLLINAFHALEESGGLVRVSCYEEDNQIVIQVYDDGPGIPIEIQDKIFQPFFTTKSFDKGTGLGLAIVQQVVDEYKGSIKLDSKSGFGTSFTIRFPVKVVEDE